MRIVGLTLLNTKGLEFFSDLFICAHNSVLRHRIRNRPIRQANHGLARAALQAQHILIALIKPPDGRIATIRAAL
jgi:hypothetical protein